ncbi:ABC transporter substrate-binding protein [Afifella sp. IM 167]|uniref:ABC transporter substrate-binding protein n=1 Tax=Afifella sp. IM 167 TaxID=2033586 RepID=UPI001CCBD84C|nr:ABC transporter substrate-binding protein [Afifella sp. IM 167]MBZ8132048.1 sugar ABC transporter substrate-binding protein [Afifella sp. IM 167]
MGKRILSAFAGLAAGAALFAGGAHAEESVEVLHWWTAGGEAAALNVLKDQLEEQGVTWQDMPVAGGSGVQAMTVLRSRVTSGNAPTAVQMLGYDIQDWANEGVLADLSDLAAKEKWDDVVPKALQRFAKNSDGQWIAAPVNVHSTNWMWANKKIFDEVGVEGEVKDWDELIAVLDKIKEAGYTPIAYGGQPWQDATVFEAVVLSTGGPEFYKKALNDFDPEALGSDTMKTAFDRMSKLHEYVDPNFSGRDWNLATAMVINGKAAVQFMGDWAKGEFLRADLKPGEDFVCQRFPGTQGTVLFNSDQFVMFQVGEDKRDAQIKLASAVMSPTFQIAFNKVKGSVPARTDVPGDELDACGQKGMKELAAANESNQLFGSLAHGYGAPSAVKNAVFDVVTAHFNGEYTSDEAVKALVEAVSAAQ